MASVLFRLPPVVSADAINSDAAVVALQAKHMLAGEWSWFLWGIGYQSSVDPLSVAIGFWIGGVSARALVVVMLVGHLAIVSLAYVALRRRLERWTAAWACAPLVFTPMAINLILIYGARQWCIAALFGAVALLDG
ncbi:MAG TPA: hypothetical protein VFA20_30330, partial [Myxococcaceae bacterium]|nr:hypothetical protein [Myxococcaceae bacterium]